MAFNILGGDGHIGSWGTPDIGFTEWLAGDNPRNDQGGSVNGQPTAADISGSLNGGQSQYLNQLNGNVLGLTTTAPAPTTDKKTTNPTTKTETKTNNNNNNNNQGNWWSDSQNMGYFNGQLFRDANEWRKASGMDPYGGNGGNGGVDWDSLYNPQFQALSDLSNYIQSSSSAEKSNRLADYNRTKSDILGEQTNLEEGLNLQQQQLADSGRSAAAEALRSYNALMQQNSSRYGMGTGAGQFLSDLIGQEYLRSKSGVDQQTQSGQAQLALEGQKTKQYITKKLGDLDSWKNDAFKAIDDNLQSKLYEIGSQKGVLEAQKAQQKQQALFDAINYKQQVQQNDQNFRMQLATFAVQNLQNVTGQSYTPQQIAAVVNEMMGAEIKGITGQQNNVVAYNPYAVMGKKTDEYGNPLET